MNRQRVTAGIVEVLVEHAKECGSDHCAACECGWDSASDDGLRAHAAHVACVLASTTALALLADEEGAS